MRVLVVHNRYRSALPSGENRVVDDEVEMLREAGIDVDTYIRSSDEIEGFGPRQKAGLAMRPILSLEDGTRFREKLALFRPDVVHLHNPFPLISPHIIRIAKRQNIPVVQTVHNYRHVCPAGTCFRNGQVCQDCSGKRAPWPSVIHGCYRDSRVQSLAMTASAGVHRSTWKSVDRFLPVSEFLGRTLEAAGVPQEQICVKYNAVNDPGPPMKPGDPFLYAARLVPEKGVELLLDAWEMCSSDLGSQLTIAGEGPLSGQVSERVSGMTRVRYLGNVDRNEMNGLLQECRAVVIPSLWYEGFPTLAIEAFAHGRAVIGVALGAMGDLIDERGGGRLCEATADGLASAMRDSSYEWCQEAGTDGRRRYEMQHTRSAVTRRLLEIYSELVSAQRPRSANVALKQGESHGTA